jgi:hypothetical protein
MIFTKSMNIHIHQRYWKWMQGRENAKRYWRLYPNDNCSKPNPY